MEPTADDLVVWDRILQADVPACARCQFWGLRRQVQGAARLTNYDQCRASAPRWDGMTAFTHGYDWCGQYREGRSPEGMIQGFRDQIAGVEPAPPDEAGEGVS